MKTLISIIALSAGGALAGVGTTTVDFNDGTTQGWEGPQGFGGSSFVDPTHGVDGTGGLRTQFNNFGIDFYNNTNSAFLGDYTQYDEVTISFDLRIDQIGAFLPVPRPFMLELRNNDLGDAGYPWASAYLLFDWYSADSFEGFTTLSATFDPNAVSLPTGWGGTGSEDPNTFEPTLPDGVTFADVLSGVDEIAISTILPGFFFTFDDYDVTLDNISITTVPAPSALALIGLGGIVGTRRRR
jgi:MYXO-CTERM domain-containing protein